LAVDGDPDALVEADALPDPIGAVVEDVAPGVAGVAAAGFFVGCVVVCFVGCFVGAGAGARVAGGAGDAGAIPGGSPPPFCHENATLPPAGTVSDPAEVLAYFQPDVPSDQYIPQ
jgi:hypothetical protein